MTEAGTETEAVAAGAWKGRRTHGHPRPDLFGSRAFEPIVVDLAGPAGNVLFLPVASGQPVRSGHTMTTTQQNKPTANLA